MITYCKVTTLRKLKSMIIDYIYLETRKPDTSKVRTMVDHKSLSTWVMTFVYCKVRLTGNSRWSMAI